MGKQGALVPFGEKIKLSDYDAGSTGEYGKKSEVRDLIKANLARMAELQELLFAEGKHALLIVLQAMDAGGKDSTIRHVRPLTHRAATWSALVCPPSWSGHTIFCGGSTSTPLGWATLSSLTDRTMRTCSSCG